MAEEKEELLVGLEELEAKVKQVQEEFNAPPPPPEEQAHPFNDFPPEIIESLDGLMWVGYLEDHFSMFGHSFTIRTLRGQEELLAAQVCAEWSNTLGQAKAWVWAQLALAIVAVDGDTNWCPAIGPDEKAHARAKFKYLTEHWYWATAEYIFGRYSDLIVRQEEAYKALENL